MSSIPVPSLNTTVILPSAPTVTQSTIAPHSRSSNSATDAQDALVLAQERDATFAPARSVTSLLKAVLMSSSVICHRHITHGAFASFPAAWTGL